MLVKMLGRETLIARAIQPFDLLLAVTRHPFGRRLAKPAIHQPGLALRLEANAPTAKRPFGDAEQLSRFDLVEVGRFIAAQNTPKLDHSHTLKGFRPAHPGSPQRAQYHRTDRVLPKPDISCAIDT